MADRFSSDNPNGAHVPLSVPYIRGNEAKYLQECLDSNWVSSAGPFVSRFEEMFSRYIGTKFGIATVNGTAALHIALLVAGIKPEHEVLVSTLTFIAPINAIRYVGAWPVLVDAEPESWQMDTSIVKRFLEENCHLRNGLLINSTTGRQVKAIMPVHILGHPCNMKDIAELAFKYGLTVIEDATESLGARYNGSMVGHLGDLACFSFNGNKLITTGGGGMLVTDNAALGCGQLEQIDSYFENKREIAKTYIEDMGTLPGIKNMKESEWAESVFWLYTVLIDQDIFGMDSRTLLNELGNHRIDSRPLWQPNHLSPAHSRCQVLGGECAENLYQNCLSLPCSVGLSKADQRRVTDTIVSVAD